MGDLYRITSLEGLLSLLLTHEERYVNPIDCWEDTYEGYYLHMLDSHESSQMVIRRLYDEVCDGDLDLTLFLYTKLQRSRFLCYGQCWSRLKDSDALWRVYSYGNKAVQLVSSKERIEGMIGGSDWEGKVRVGNISYDLDDGGSELSRVVRKGTWADAPFFHKRPAFKHEEETRVLLRDSKTSDSFAAFQRERLRSVYDRTSPTLPVEARIAKASRQLFGSGEDAMLKQIFEKSVKVTVPDVRSYLKGVRVHPFADAWYVGTVELLCEAHGVTFLGQSDLYRDPC